MYLVDTSVWINYFRGKQTHGVTFLDRLLKQKAPYGLTGMIYQEILQGSASSRDLKQLVSFLAPQRFYEPKDKMMSYEAAAMLYYHCRKKGMTIRSTVDCLIAQIAIEHNLILVHEDQDFVQLARVAPELCLFE